MNKKAATIEDFEASAVMPSPWLQSVLLLLKQVAVKLEFFC
jgi:hypothetical protein